jgi:glutaredoxin
MKITYSFFTLNVALLVFISSFSQQVTADQLYKWVDKKGNVTYQSSPPPEGAENVERSEIRRVVEEEQVGTEVVFETDPVKFYTIPDCPACNDARTYFEEKEIPFEEVDVSEDTAAAANMERTFGHNDVPTMKVGNKSVTGFQKQVMYKILKNAGYDLPEEADTEEDAEKGSQ